MRRARCTSVVVTSVFGPVLRDLHDALQRVVLTGARLLVVHQLHQLGAMLLEKGAVRV